MPRLRTAELLKELNERIERVKHSREFKELLKFFSKFHSYSYQNSLLIMMQKPKATLVAGYRQWQEKFDRQVKKGEKGIAILAPFTYKKEADEYDKAEGEEVKKTYFRPVYVFDVSQTEGESLPSIDLKIENTRKELLPIMEQFAAKSDITVSYKKLREGLNGFSRGGKVVLDINANPTEKSAVLAHEIAHELLHFVDDEEDWLTDEVRELEAEAVAFVVMDFFGVEIESEKYLALYKKSYDLMESLKRIKTISDELIDYIFKKLNE